MPTLKKMIIMKVEGKKNQETKQKKKKKFNYIQGGSKLFFLLTIFKVKGLFNIAYVQRLRYKGEDKIFLGFDSFFSFLQTPVI